MRGLFSMGSLLTVLWLADCILDVVPSGPRKIPEGYDD